MIFYLNVRLRNHISQIIIICIFAACRLFATLINIINMENPGPFATRDTALKYSEAMALLQNHNPETVRLCPAVKPLGGQMFLISSGNEETKLKDWMCDQYKWKVNNGVNSYPSRSKSPLVKKYYHKLSSQDKVIIDYIILYITIYFV